MFLINGAWQETLPANDRAIQFGDGCFTTARIRDGEVCLLVAHLERLKQACERLLIPFSAWAELNTEMVALAEEHREGVLKVIISRGSGGRGYSTASCTAPTRLLSVSPLPTHYAQWRERGITLTLSPIRLGRNPSLAGLKHLNRLEQVLIRSHLDQSGADEALVLDSDGWLTECCAANLFWRKGRVVFTPRLDQAGVNGLMRQRILSCLQHSAWQVNEVSETVATLDTADEVILCNALMPLVPVGAFENRTWVSRELYQFLAPHCE
ncbi:aminodeoxychorismate lyase [Enterobacteriaceae bacterium]